jgi:hypothetical protein
MLNDDDVLNNFTDIVDLAGDVLKFKDVIPAFTYVYYLTKDTNSVRNILVVVQNREDDIYAKKLLKAGGETPYNPSGLYKCAFNPENDYLFTHILVVPPQYHSYFKGRLDAERTELFLVFPVYQYEFSGDESVELFYQLRREIVPTLDWNRAPSPKAMVRFDNPKTGGGTIGATAIPFRYTVLKEEIRNLDGVESGFVEVTSYRGDYFEVISNMSGVYSCRQQGQSSGRSLKYPEVIEELWLFLTR